MPDDSSCEQKYVALCYVTLNGEDIKRSPDFYYLGSIVAENGGTSREVNARIQKARGSFSKLRRVWLSH